MTSDRAPMVGPMPMAQPELLASTPANVSYGAPADPATGAAGDPRLSPADAAWEASARLVPAFLLAYRPATASGYASDLSDFFRYATQVQTPPLAFTRTKLELYVHHLTASRGLAPSTVGRRLAALSGYFAFALADDVIAKNPMDTVRRPRLATSSQSLGLEREELIALLDAAARHSPRAKALITLLVLNGLRISEALNADIEHLGNRRGLTTLTITRKGGNLVDVPLAPAAEQAVRQYVGSRISGPILLSRTGRRLDRSNSARLLRAVARLALPGSRAGALHPHVLRHAFVAGLLDAGVPLHEVQRAASHASPATTMRYDRSRVDVSPDHPTFALADWLGAT